jgi:hypothetical protein
MHETNTRKTDTNFHIRNNGGQKTVEYFFNAVTGETKTLSTQNPVLCENFLAE